MTKKKFDYNSIREDFPLVEREDDSIEKINELLESAKSNVYNALNKILEVGRILTEEKKNREGTFNKWIIENYNNKNLPFGLRQAQRYIKAYQKALEEDPRDMHVVSLNSYLRLLDKREEELHPEQEEDPLPEKQKAKEKFIKLEKEIDSLNEKVKAKKTELKKLAKQYGFKLKQKGEL
ncbi:MAG: hypothetical protein KDK36_09660 [Leptospiraceae bacterium]|nr:hypothetical protein [Leptospiraceae bacterium]